MVQEKSLNQTIERTTLTNLICNEDYARKVLPFIKSNYFDEREEQKLIKVMKRATDLMIKANSKEGTQSTDHYSMMGFTKAYNTAKKKCS